MSDFGDIMRAILRGEKSDDAIKDFLVGLNEAGLTSEQVRIGVEIMRENMTPVTIPDAIDIVGTGGTGLHTLSISTASALVCAGAGARVAKHGNRAASSLTGTADTLSNHHPAMRFVGPARKAIGKRTLFNLLGPMSNPAGTKRMLVGVNQDVWRHLMAEAFLGLGVEHIWVVHGSDGLDEITTTGPTYVSEVKDGKVTEFTISPESYGIDMTTIESLRGGHPAENAMALRGLLHGEHSDYRDIVRLNAGAALMLAGLASDIPRGIDMATESIDSGKARAALETLIEVSNG